MININFIFPEIFLSISIMFSLLFSVFKKNSAEYVYNICIFSLFVTIGLLLNNSFDEKNLLFDRSYKIDYLSNIVKVITLITSSLVLITSIDYLKKSKILKSEYPILINSSILGMLVMLSSNDLIVFYIGLELQSLALYVLSSFKTNSLSSSEAGLKYFVLSALSSGLLLYGCSLVYGFTGTTNFDIISQNLDTAGYGILFALVFILVGLAFKISAVPFHMWAPDVYEGSPTSVTLFFALVPKLVITTMFIKILYIPFLNLIDEWQTIIVFLSIASMVFGAVAAIGQKNLKRLIAYSSIGHMGYVLAGIATGTNTGIESSLVYLAIYIMMTLGIFCCIFMIKKENKYFEDIENLSGLSKNHPVLSLSFLIMLFSLAGIPPLAGFFAKFYIFIAVIEKEMYFLAVIGLLATVISAFYYLRIIKIIYFDDPHGDYEREQSLSLRLPLLISSIFVLFYFIFPAFLSEIFNKINLI